MTASLGLANVLRVVQAANDVDLFESIPSAEPLTNLFLARTQAAPNRVAAYSKSEGRWVGTTWAQARQSVEECALGLLELGVREKMAVAILADTRKEWVHWDLAIQSIGAITVGIYPTLTGEQVRQLLELSGARVIFVDERSLRVKAEECSEDLLPRVQIISLEPTADGERVVTVDELRRRGAKRRQAHPEEWLRRLREVKSSDVVSYIYTSGTTGEPKGAMLTHANFHYVIHATNALIPYAGERGLVFLPLAHSLQRYATYLSLVVDIEAYFAESIDRVPDNLLEVRPSCFAVVPRILEKIHRRAIESGKTGPQLRQRFFQRSLHVLHDVGAKRRDGAVPGIRARFYARAADRLVGQRVRERLGGRVKFIGCGSAPLPRETHEFFENLSIPILEGYGLTETSAPVTLNTLENRRIGTVGRPLPGTDIRIADDGEILVKGPGVFLGYYQDVAETSEAFDEEGWFKTGDVGEMSRDGFVTLTDRKKDIIITSGGKNVAPQAIERELMNHPLLAQAVVVGDGRPYLSALLALSPAVRDKLVEQHRLPSTTRADQLVSLPEVKAQLDAHVDAVNRQRPRFEQIKSYAVLPETLSIEGGELTPTMKVKRYIVASHYGDLIEKLYRAGAA